MIALAAGPPTKSFNPPPAMRPGETTWRAAIALGMTSFNPPPAMRPGETGTWVGWFADKIVSIRPRR